MEWLIAQVNMKTEYGGYKANMTTIGIFPFGEPVKTVTQADRSEKNVFVLGVYASAVHACWINNEGKNLVTALAVASEPFIFWRGEGADSIINKINIPDELGSLVPARDSFNGPSGIALDDLILKPLGLERKDTWLCDLVPHSCVNPAQRVALEREYFPNCFKYNLPMASVPKLPSPITDDARRNEISHELQESKARILILLGDMPIRWYLKFFDTRWSKLSDFMDGSGSYGQLHDAIIAGRKVTILPLAHPRQIAKLGRSSQYWFDIHAQWIKQTSSSIFKLL